MDEKNTAPQIPVPYQPIRKGKKAQDRAEAEAEIRAAMKEAEAARDKAKKERSAAEMEVRAQEKTLAQLKDQLLQLLS